MNSDIRNTLCREIESELEKNAEQIDPDYIDQRIDELCKLEAHGSRLRPPKIAETQVNAVINRITARAHRIKPAKRLHPLARLVAASCFVVAFIFFAFNYVYDRATNRYSPKGKEIALCCGTDYCTCEIKKEHSGSE